MASTSALDDATLRQVFAQAAADTSMPTSTKELRRLRLHNLWEARKNLFLTLIGIGTVVALIALVAGSPEVTAFIVFGGLVTWLTIFLVQSSRATNDYVTRYATTRGLILVEDVQAFAESVPLLGRGDKRVFGRRMTGTIAGQASALGHYTYTVVTTDSDGNRSETDHDFTTLEFPLPPAVAERFAGVYLSKAKWSLGALQDKLAHDRKVELESIDFHKRYTLRVRDEQDNIALYELFSTTFVDRLTNEFEAHWEQVSGSLVLYRDKHLMDADELDMFCLQGWHVLQRYLEEHQ